MGTDAKLLRKVALSSPAGFLAFGFGSGLSPRAPGTMGTLVAVPIAMLLEPLSDVAQLGLVAVLFVLGIYVCEQTSARLGVHDHGGIVWDEITGFLLCIIAAPATVTGYVLAFVLFRVFDIFKPWPISIADRKLKGGFGIMFDDIIAAAYAAAIMLTAVWLDII
jgi:phosphatidylglycerophosphatase A